MENGDDLSFENFISGCYCRGSNHMSCGQICVSYFLELSSAPARLHFAFAEHVVVGLLLSVPLLFYEQLPFSSLISLPSSISSFVFSPKKFSSEHNIPNTMSVQ